LKNVEILDESNLTIPVIKIFDKYKSVMMEELKDANADTSKFKVREFYPVIRFKLEEAEIFQEPRVINDLKKGGKYNRYKPYIIEGGLEEMIIKKMASKPFKFSPGKRKNDKSSYCKKYSNKSALVKGLHAQIINDLENYLKPKYSLSLNNISIEKTVFGENIADIVTIENDSFSIFEVKTSYNNRYNIREAIGQLLDYALWHEEVKINELIIVAPSEITQEHKNYLIRLNANLNLTIQFLSYNPANKDKFEVITI
jgi:hypothetical protein